MKELILSYLNKSYHVKDNILFSNNSEISKSPNLLQNTLKKTFDVDLDVLHLILFEWLFNNGMKNILDNWVNIPKSDYPTNNQLNHLSNVWASGNNPYQIFFDVE